MSCTVCQHPKRQAIDQALIAGSVTLAALSQEHGLSTSALHRHKAHLQAKVSRGKAQLQDNLRQGCYFWISQALEMSLETARSAQAEGNGALLLQALGHGIRLITLLQKQELTLDDLTLYQILNSPQWAAQESILPRDPEILAAGRQTLISQFAAPCPEADPGPPLPVSKGNPKQEQLQAKVASKAQPPVNTAPPANCKPAADHRRAFKWEKGGKLPGKSTLLGDINDQFQLDSLKDKITGMFHPFQSPQFPELASQGPLLASGDLPADKPLSEYIYEQSLKAGSGSPTACIRTE